MARSSSPVVAVVGRPNVGKSTLFNRVLGSRVAIVDEAPGVTRDRNFAPAEWAGREFFIVDTGGVVEEEEGIDRSVREQALAAVEQADVILCVVDGRAGVHPLDQRMADILRESGRPVVLAVNKMDRYPDESDHHDFWTLGLGEPSPVSAISGKGSGDLLDRVVAHLPEEAPGDRDPDTLRVAVVGKPNVGKSSFVNRLLGEDRVVVNDVPGTTRDPVDTPLVYHGRRMALVDTAGLRRQSRVSDSLEYYSAIRTERVVQEADVCIVLVDAVDGVHAQDLKIVDRAWEAGAGVILCLNKWDEVENRGPQATAEITRYLQQKMPQLRWVPLLFISALTGQRVRRTLDRVLEVEEERERRIPTPEVNEVLEELVRKQPPPHSQGRAVRIKFATQVATAPPTFVLFSNLPKEIPEHYLRYLHNGFRERWGFSGTALRLLVRQSRRTRSPTP